MTTQSTSEVFTQAFLAATPDIAAEILDYSYKMPMWLADLWELKKWEANDNVMQQLVFRGSMPEVERGFNLWKQLASSAGCEPCVNDCSYNFTQFHGHAFERRLISLMRREFKTETYCVNEIKSTHEFEQVFGKIIENIQTQVAFFKEYNIGLNFLTGIAKKLIVDSGGIKGNSADPYQYRALGTATLSKLNFRMLTKLYEGLRRRSDVVPFDIQNGQPIYAISASDELMDDLYIADANARADLRFSSAADASLTRYNFMSSIRGQFINAPLLYPRRFNYESSQWVEVFPFVNGIPAEIGTFSDLNPAWEAAAYEEVLIYGKSPFSVFYRDQITTIGQGTNFGPESSFMNQWLWVNPQTDCDPFRRSGFYATSIEMALAPQYSGGVYGIMVPRPSAGSVAEFFPAAVCPPDSVVCDNEVPAITTCPCPLVLSATADPFNAARYTIVFGVPIDAVPTDTLQLGLATGGYITGTVSAITSDGLTLSIQFATGTVIDNCAGLTAVFCDNTLGCSSLVSLANDCRSGETGDFRVILANPIKADTAGDIVYGAMGDGTTQHFSVVSVDMMTNTWVLEYATGYGPSDDPTGAGSTNLNADIVCDRNGIISICVPPATDATCPACGTGPVVTACSEA
jgi:hypothetical protein